jgi:hypothetical protein
MAFVGASRIQDEYCLLVVSILYSNSSKSNQHAPVKSWLSEVQAMWPLDTETLAARTSAFLLQRSLCADESNVGRVLYNEERGASLSTLSASKDRRRRGR